MKEKKTRQNQCSQINFRLKFEFKHIFMNLLGFTYHMFVKNHEIFLVVV